MVFGPFRSYASIDVKPEGGVYIAIYSSLIFSTIFSLLFLQMPSCFFCLKRKWGNKHRSFGGNSRTFIDLIGTLLQSKNYAILASNVAKVKLFCTRKKVSSRILGLECICEGVARRNENDLGPGQPSSISVTQSY